MTDQWLQDNQRRLPSVFKQHLQWVSDHTHDFENVLLEEPPTMRQIKERLVQARLKQAKQKESGAANSAEFSMSSAATAVAMRKPTMLPIKNPLRVEQLQRLLQENETKWSNSQVQHLCEAVQGYHPGALKAPLENWLFDSFLCTAEQVIPDLWLGGFVAAHDFATIAEMKVTNVLCVGGRALAFGEKEYHPPFPDKLDYKLIHVDDTEKAADVDALGRCFPEAVAFIEDCLISKQTPLLVHCMAGASRSASVVCAYLIWKYQLTVEDALRLVRSARPIATPNAAFVAQLEEWHRKTIQDV
ncbi:MAG: hypothetical protein SGILL_006446 [Bacillariaceae sp.]